MKIKIYLMFSKTVLGYNINNNFNWNKKHTFKSKDISKKFETYFVL